MYGVDYQLAWPRELFAAEVRALLDVVQPDDWKSRLALLLDEAFLGSAPASAFASRMALASVTHRGEDRTFAAELVAAADSLPEPRDPAALWSQRRRRAVAAPGGAEPAAARRIFVALVDELQRRGYLARAFGDPCVDDRGAEEFDPDAVLADRVGVTGLWPLRPDGWDEDTFYDLVEVFHDLVARPGERTWHDYGREWHYAAFALEPACGLYVWRVNRLLADAGTPVRLAGSGENAGRLEEQVDEARVELVERATQSPDASVATRVRHAIALFRRRGATREDKRDAIGNLAAVLEDRRRLLKRELGKDESALFNVANNFDLRHRNAVQRIDYDPLFLDWVFWWYLATVELTDRLIAREATAP